MRKFIGRSRRRLLTVFLLLALVAGSVVPASADTKLPDGKVTFGTSIEETFNTYFPNPDPSIAGDGTRVQKWISPRNSDLIRWTEGYQKELYFDNAGTTAAYIYDDPNLVAYVGASGGGGDIVTWALSQVGVRASPSDRNDVIYTDWYGSGKVPWCCIFVTWCATQCGYVNSGVFPRTASCTSFYNIMVNQKGYHSFSVAEAWNGTAGAVMPGDIVVFSDSPGSGSYCHIGIVVEVGEGNSYIDTVEGNTDGMFCISGHDNPGVYRQRYTPGTYNKFDNGDIIRPVYPTVQVSGNVSLSGFMWPLTSSINTLTSLYGPRPNPFTGAPDNHTGIDISATTGTTVMACKAGKVIRSEIKYGDAGGLWTYGNYVAIDHEDGTYTLYAHMSRRSVVVGQTVTQGQKIGEVGSTGNSTGPHLHLEVRNGGFNASSRVDPITAFDSMTLYYSSSSGRVLLPH